MPATPPFTLTPAVLDLCTRIGEQVGRLSALEQSTQSLRLRRINRIRTVHGSLAIEGNTLSEEQITAILDGKRVLAPPREIQEAHNALITYERFGQWQPHKPADLLAAHRSLMEGLLGWLQVTDVHPLIASPQVSHHVTPQVKALLKFLQGEMSREEIMLQLKLSDRKSFSARYLQPALQQGLIEMTIPDKPRSRSQRYRLTQAGLNYGH